MSTIKVCEIYCWSLLIANVKLGYSGGQHTRLSGKADDDDDGEDDNGTEYKNIKETHSESDDDMIEVGMNASVENGDGDTGMVNISRNTDVYANGDETKEFETNEDNLDLDESESENDDIAIVYNKNQNEEETKNEEAEIIFSNNTTGVPIPSEHEKLPEYDQLQVEEDEKDGNEWDGTKDDDDDEETYDKQYTPESPHTHQTAIMHGMDQDDTDEY